MIAPAHEKKTQKEDFSCSFVLVSVALRLCRERWLWNASALRDGAMCRSHAEWLKGWLEPEKAEFTTKRMKIKTEKTHFFSLLQRSNTIFIYPVFFTAAAKLKNQQKYKSTQQFQLYHLYVCKGLHKNYCIAMLHPSMQKSTLTLFF